MFLARQLGYFQLLTSRHVLVFLLWPGRHTYRCIHIRTYHFLISYSISKYCVGMARMPHRAIHFQSLRTYKLRHSKPFKLCSCMAIYSRTTTLTASMLKRSRTSFICELPKLTICPTSFNDITNRIFVFPASVQHSLERRHCYFYNQQECCSLR